MWIGEFPGKAEIRFPEKISKSVKSHEESYLKSCKSHDLVHEDMKIIHEDIMNTMKI